MTEADRPGPAGAVGATGAAGATGATGPAAAANPACPIGYTQAAQLSNPFNSNSVLCKKGVDEVVKVGTDGTAFWIDRYEASVWTALSSGTQKFASSDESTNNFPRNGQVVVPLYALSVPSLTSGYPSRYLTWFQAAEACEASGKRLPTGREWLRAARGTFDPGSNNGTPPNTQCNTTASGPRNTGLGLGASAVTSCVSDWGAQDMIGNLWEWTDEWYAGLYDSTGYGAKYTWPDQTNGPFNGDGTWNISSYAAVGSVGWQQGFPAAALRGGAWGYGPAAGIFALNLTYGPAYWLDIVGFRCIVPR